MPGRHARGPGIPASRVPGLAGWPGQSGMTLPPLRFLLRLFLRLLRALFCFRLGLLLGLRAFLRLARAWTSIWSRAWRWARAHRIASRSGSAPAAAPVKASVRRLRARRRSGRPQRTSARGMRASDPRPASRFSPRSCPVRRSGSRVPRARINVDLHLRLLFPHRLDVAERNVGIDFTEMHLHRAARLLVDVTDDLSAVVANRRSKPVDLCRRPDTRRFRPCRSRGSRPVPRA